VSVVSVVYGYVVLRVKIAYSGLPFEKSRQTIELSKHLGHIA